MGLSPGNVVCMHWVFSGYFKVAGHETMNGIGNAHYVQFLPYLQHDLQIGTVSYGKPREKCSYRKDIRFASLAFLTNA